MELTAIHRRMLDRILKHVAFGTDDNVRVRFMTAPELDRAFSSSDWDTTLQRPVERASRVEVANTVHAHKQLLREAAYKLRTEGLSSADLADITRELANPCGRQVVSCEYRLSDAARRRKRPRRSDRDSFRLRRRTDRVVELTDAMGSPTLTPEWMDLAADLAAARRISLTEAVGLIMGGTDGKAARAAS